MGRRNIEITKATHCKITLVIGKALVSMVTVAQLAMVISILIPLFTLCLPKHDQQTN